MSTGGAGGDTDLTKAILALDLTTMDDLLKGGQNVNQPRQDGGTPLKIALDQFYENYGNPTVKSIILRLLDEPSILINSSEFEMAIDIGNDILDKVLSKGIDINHANLKGQTLLHSAVKDNRVDRVVKLLEKGANIEKGADDGQSVLHYAAMDGNKEMVDVLLAHGANVNRADIYGFTPLMAAATAYKTKINEIVQALLEKGAEPNMTIPETGMTAGHYFLLNDGDPNDPIISSICNVPFTKIQDDLNLPMLDAKPPVLSDEKIPVFTFIGHGIEIMSEIGKNVEFLSIVGDFPRKKMKENRILLTVEECGIMSFFDIQERNAVQYGSQNTAEKNDLFKNLFSPNKIMAGRAKDDIQKAMNLTKLHMYRKDDEFPIIQFYLDTKYRIKSGLYLNPLVENDFLEKIEGKEEMIMKRGISDEEYFKNSLFPTPSGVEKLRKILMPLHYQNRSLVDEMSRLFRFTKTDIGSIMDVFGKGVYVFPACRALLRHNIHLANLELKFNQNNITHFNPNILERIRIYNSLPNSDKNRNSANILSEMAHAKTHVPRIRRNSIIQQSQYNTRVGGGAAGGTAVAGATRRFRRRVRATKRRRKNKH